MDITIEKLNAADTGKFTALLRVFEEVFEMKDFKIPDEQYLQHILSKEDFFVFVAIVHNNIVGGLTSYSLQQYYSVSPLAYIYDLAIQPAFHRQGIGTRLISTLTSFCKDHGFEEAFVQTDEADDYAVAFYRSTGALEKQVKQFYYRLQDKPAACI